jgi:hypothetical protein
MSDPPYFVAGGVQNYGRRMSRDFAQVITKKRVGVFGIVYLFKSLISAKRFGRSSFLRCELDRTCCQWFFAEMTPKFKIAQVVVNKDHPGVLALTPLVICAGGD